MKFTVISISLVPDTELGRHLYKLNNLDEKDISKILFHKRKQETGHTEELRLAYQRIASLTRLKYRDGQMSMRTYTVPEDNEPDVLSGLLSATKSADHLVTWHGAKIDIPLLRYRSMHYQLRVAKFWRRIQNDTGYHLDLARALFDDNERAKISLNDLAVCTGLPGLMDSAALDPWKARLAGDFQALRAGTELTALNLYLLALRYWLVTGHSARKDIAAAETELRILLEQSEAPYLRAFLDRWIPD